MLSSRCSARRSAVMLPSIIRSLFLLSALSPKRFMYRSTPPQTPPPFVCHGYAWLTFVFKPQIRGPQRFCSTRALLSFSVHASAVCVLFFFNQNKCRNGVQSLAPQRKPMCFFVFFAFALKGDGAVILFHQGLCNDELYFWVMFWYSESQMFARWRVQDESPMMSSMPAQERVKQHQRLVVTLIWMYNLKTVRHSCYCATPALIGVRGLQARNVAPVTGWWDLPRVLEGVTRRARVPRTR